MKKSLLLAALLVFGVGMGSCDKDSETPKTLVDVTLQAPEPMDVESRTIVTGSGVTRWATGDVVTLVDVDKTLRAFNYLGTSSSTEGQFKGQLYGEQGPSTYYGYYGPEMVPCIMDNNHILAITRTNLNLSENGEINSKVFGKYCPMIAIPIKFDADNPVNAGLQFHHVTSLIEASVAFAAGSAYWDVSFDEVRFELRAEAKDPQFNTKVSLNLKSIKGKPDDEVEIPFTEDTENREHIISTVLNYTSAKTLGERASGDTGCYSIPIFSLPTKLDIKCHATVTFSNEGKEVLKLYRRVGFDGLNPAGLNTVDLDEEHVVTE